jgi:hypothetical protein
MVDEQPVRQAMATTRDAEARRLVLDYQPPVDLAGIPPWSEFLGAPATLKPEPDTVSLGAGADLVLGRLALPTPTPARRGRRRTPHASQNPQKDTTSTNQPRKWGWPTTE